MKNRWTWTIFGVGTTIGTLLFTSCQGPDASAIIRLPKEAHIIKIENKVFPGEVWFDLPATRTPEDWLVELGRLNSFEENSNDKWSKPKDIGMSNETASVEYADGKFHAIHQFSLTIPSGQEDIFGK